MIFILFICVVYVTVADGAVARIAPDTTPGHLGHCNSKTTGPMKDGEEKSLADCVAAICEHDGTILLTSCGVIDSSCKTTALDKTKPYPDCCPKVIKCN